MLGIRHPLLGTLGARRTLQAIAMFFSMAMTANVNAFPILNLSPGTPDIGSAFVSVTYTVNAGIGTLTARGQAQQLTPSAQGGSPNIQNADFFSSFDLNATINNNNQTAAGTLVISGETPADGFTSGTLLTGTLSAFGAGAADPLEFLFDVDSFLRLNRVGECTIRAVDLINRHTITDTIGLERVIFDDRAAEVDDDCLSLFQLIQCFRVIVFAV